ncbi:MAG: serine O-acetyltransferase [Bacteroidaceae bacterium]|jgi:serine O-acetyltransferase
MSGIDFTHVLTESVEKLSQPESYRLLMHQHRDGEPLPSNKVLREVVELARAILFPGYYGNSTLDSRTLSYHIGVGVERLYGLLEKQIRAGLCFSKDCEEDERLFSGRVATSGATKQPESDCAEALHQKAAEMAAAFVSRLPELRQVLSTDVVAAYNGDPAATSYGEVICCYPAIRAISNYRIAHELLVLGVPLIPRIITEMAHSETGIDIHPGAQIGSYFTIDHGTGVVIGATSIIGNGVKLYQGVTLGAKSFPLDSDGNPIKGIPRHPILEDDVIVYSNATILGRITIGRGATIGGNLWVTESVPPGGRIVQRRG